MGMVLLYRQISFDTASLRMKGHPQATFFEADSRYIDGSTRITNFSERELVRWLMLFAPARQMLFEELGRNGAAFYRPEVVEPFYSPGQGDIDLVMCHLSAPHQSVAVECKRVKVAISDPENDQLNKLENIRGGVVQANRLYSRFGFFQTCLGVVTAVEASEQLDTNIPNRGVRSSSTPDFGDTKTFKRIVEFPGRDELNAAIGIIFIEIVQPSLVSIDRRATIRVCVHHPPAPRTQTTDGRTVWRC